MGIVFNLFLSKLKPLLISRSKAKNKKNAGAAAKKALKQQNASFEKLFCRLARSKSVMRAAIGGLLFQTPNFW